MYCVDGLPSMALNLKISLWVFSDMFWLQQYYVHFRFDKSTSTIKIVGVNCKKLNIIRRFLNLNFTWILIYP